MAAQRPPVRRTGAARRGGKVNWRHCAIAAVVGLVVGVWVDREPAQSAAVERVTPGR